jgi:hypothetical protein
LILGGYDEAWSGFYIGIENSQTAMNYDQNGYQAKWSRPQVVSKEDNSTALDLR